MIVQIYSIVSKEYALKCIELGVDHLGIVPDTNLDRSEKVSYDVAKEIIELTRGKAKICAITFSNNADQIVELANLLRPDYIHLSPNWENNAIEVTRKVKEQLSGSGIQVLRALPVIDESSIETAKELESACDVICLDTYKKGLPNLGATGEVNDWDLCAEIVKTVSIPVILAVGLGPDNVQKAIKKVRPWGVDSKSKTDVKGAEPYQKDYEAIERFVKLAKEW